MNRQDTLLPPLHHQRATLFFGYQERIQYRRTSQLLACTGTEQYLITNNTAVDDEQNHSTPLHILHITKKKENQRSVDRHHTITT